MLQKTWTRPENVRKVEWLWPRIWAGSTAKGYKIPGPSTQLFWHFLAWLVSDTWENLNQARKFEKDWVLGPRLGLASLLYSSNSKPKLKVQQAVISYLATYACWTTNRLQETGIILLLLKWIQRADSDFWSLPFPFCLCVTCDNSAQAVASSITQQHSWRLQDSRLSEHQQNFALTSGECLQRLWVVWGQCCLRVATGPCLPNGPITQLSPYLTRNPFTVEPGY